MPILAMNEADLREKRVMIREDFNVPMEEGMITSDARIEAALPTIKLALAQKAKVILVSHLGRPEEGHYDAQYSLAPVAAKLSELLGQPVRLIQDWLSGFEVAAGEVVLCENVRFNVGENANDEILAKKMAELCDVFVMDAFATAHRAQASTHGVACYAKVACAGPLLTAELNALEHALANPARPMLAIVGGSKISTKLTLLEKLLDTVDHLIVGGGIANTFICAAGFYVGKSLYEENLVKIAKDLLAKAKDKNTIIPIPVDVVVATEIGPQAVAHIKAIDKVMPDEMILDIGPETAVMYQGIINQSKTIIWNGPVGVFEYPSFAKGTHAIAQAIVNTDCYSIAGGGDTVAALEKFGLEQKLSYVSTGGGAFLEFVEGKKLPAIEILERRAH